MSAYDWAFANPELIPLYLAFALTLAGWLYASFRKLFKWGNSIAAALSDRWGRGSPLPPDDVTVEIFLFTLTVSANLVLVGAYLYVVT